MKIPIEYGENENCSWIHPIKPIEFSLTPSHPKPRLLTIDPFSHNTYSALTLVFNSSAYIDILSFHPFWRTLRSTSLRSLSISFLSISLFQASLSWNNTYPSSVFIIIILFLCAPSPFFTPWPQRWFDQVGSTRPVNGLIINLRACAAGLTSQSRYIKEKPFRLYEKADSTKNPESTSTRKLPWIQTKKSA